MSKKKRKRVFKKPVRKKSNLNQKELFLKEIDVMIRKTVNNLILPLENRIDSLYTALQNVKSNVVVSNTLLETKGIFERDEFLEEFSRYERHEVGIVDGAGVMPGSPVFSLYNMEEEK